MARKVRLHAHPTSHPFKRRWAAVSIGGLALAFLSTSIGLPALSATAEENTTSSLTATAATFTTTRAPQTPQSDKPYVSATNSVDKTYIKFDTSKVGVGKTIVSASIELKVASTTATTGGVQVYPTPSTWTAATLTDANRPKHVDTQLATSLVRPFVGKTISVPLAITKSISTTAATSFELTYSQLYVGTTFVGKGASAPKLILVLADSSSTPTVPTPTPTPTTPPTTPPTAPPAAQAPSSPVGSTDLPFTVAGSNTSAKKVFAHYFPPYPVSIDNKTSSADYYANNYLTAQGEGGIHAAYGGLLRDRPLGRAPLAGDWKLADMKSEVIQASNAGIDGFTVDIMSLSGLNWDRTVALMQGAAQSGRNFTVVPNLDMTASAGKTDIPTIAAKLAELYKSPAAYKLPTGEYVLSSFAAERQTAAWWSQLKNELATKYKVKTALIAVFLQASDANLSSFAPISYALSNWGTRTATTIANGPDYAAKAHALGSKWMAPVAVQDVRPRSYLYDESNNTETLRKSWDRAISGGADFVQLVTWNDYSEGTSFAPSRAHGHSFLDVNAYYLTQFKTGKTPAIGGDAIYLTHRIQPFAAKPSTTQKLMAPTLSGTSTQPRDTVEVLTVLKAAAAVTVTIGGKATSFDAPAGVSTKTFPLALGSISASAARSGTVIASVKSPFTVVDKPAVQDLQYYGVSSRGK
ncbi:endo-1,3-alpha-glucanase family glycosylhydrolase [Leifsonia sp. A12D58]|uniref:endo-1,3-alpha-glucanase family glycosylhydrolase n=1 Tax=Leifsonia sp. A12D58 TaxID=3397674 RepID=UPI0039E017EE